MTITVTPILQTAELATWEKAHVHSHTETHAYFAVIAKKHTTSLVMRSRQFPILGCLQNNTTINKVEHTNHEATSLNNDCIMNIINCKNPQTHEWWSINSAIGIWFWEASSLYAMTHLSDIQRRNCDISQAVMSIYNRLCALTVGS